MTSSIVKHIAIQMSDRWQVDEIYFKARVTSVRMFDMMYSESRFMISTDMASDKEKYDSTDLFQESIDTAKKIPTF